MSENFRSENSVEFPILVKWWYGLIFAPIFPLCIIGASITDPNFNETEGIVLIITIIVISSVLITVLSFLSRNIIRRISVDLSTRSLVFEEFWSGLRVSKRTYPFETIDKFDLILRNMRRSRYSKVFRVPLITLIFQSGKKKYITGIYDSDNIETRANQLNNMLKDKCGFPAERFAEPLKPHWLVRDQKKLKLMIIFIPVGVLSVVTLLTLLITGVL